MSVLAVDRFGDSPEAAYGIFDGDRNEEISRLLQCTMGDVLAEEIQHSSVDSVYMCNTFLTSHRCVLHTHTHKVDLIKLFFFFMNHVCLYNNW